MSQIRPGLPVVTSQIPADGTRARAAQAAFFRAAIEQTQTTSQAQATAAPQRTAPPTVQTVDARVNATANSIPTEKPDRILRPGSLLDIKV